MKGGCVGYGVATGWYCELRNIGGDCGDGWPLVMGDWWLEW